MMNDFKALVYPPQTENGPSTSTSKTEIPETLSKFIPRPAPALAGACELTDIKTLLREWVTTITGTQGKKQLCDPRRCLQGGKNAFLTTI